jgi:hypothetical protein
MIFGEMKFNQMNETDVREDIISPLLHKLGYRKGTEFDIIRAISLRYPKKILGRKKKADPLLRGEADYICDVKNKIRWVIEAKSPDINISIDDLEQAYSYAVHQEVRAIYYCLSNGRTINFYETMKGAIDEPLLSVNYDDLTNDFQKISNLVSPEALMRDYPDYQIDVGKSLVPGSRSFAKIINGSITYENNSWGLPNLIGMTVAIKGGSVERKEGGGILAYLETLSPYDALQKLNERLGLGKFEVFCKDDELSIHPSKPSIFLNELIVEIPAGERLLNMLTWQEVVTTVPIKIYSKTIAAGHYDGEKFLGKFQVEFGGDQLPSNCVSDGKFEIYIS